MNEYMVSCIFNNLLLDIFLCQSVKILLSRETCVAQKRLGTAALSQVNV